MTLFAELRAALESRLEEGEAPALAALRRGLDDLLSRARERGPCSTLVEFLRWWQIRWSEDSQALLHEALGCALHFELDLLLVLEQRTLSVSTMKRDGLLDLLPDWLGGLARAFGSELGPETTESTRTIRGRYRIEALSVSAIAPESGPEPTGIELQGSGLARCLELALPDDVGDAGVPAGDAVADTMPGAVELLGALGGLSSTPADMDVQVFVTLTCEPELAFDLAFWARQPPKDLSASWFVYSQARMPDVATSVPDPRAAADAAEAALHSLAEWSDHIKRIEQTPALLEPVDDIAGDIAKLTQELMKERTARFDYGAASISGANPVGSWTRQFHDEREMVLDLLGDTIKTVTTVVEDTEVRATLDYKPKRLAT